MKKITPEGAVGCVVPMHREVATGTFHSILKQAHLTPEEFDAHR
jgi:predicted RNA binding protein YcfA (HicA-like mRNA interferase family)